MLKLFLTEKERMKVPDIWRVNRVQSNIDLRVFLLLPPISCPDLFFISLALLQPLYVCPLSFCQCLIHRMTDLPRYWIRKRGWRMAFGGRRGILRRCKWADNHWQKTFCSGDGRPSRIHVFLPLGPSVRFSKDVSVR